MCEEYFAEAAVIDFGSDTIKAGFAGQEAPRVVFPNVIGTVKERQDYWTVGEPAIIKYREGEVNLVRPVKHRKINTDWDKVKHISYYTMEHALRLMVTEAPMLLMLCNRSASNPCFTQGEAGIYGF